jgi:hypothetical protein
MNRQEIFDVCAKHLLTQKAKSYMDSPRGPLVSCAYRGRNGNKCAVGALIPDDKYNINMEGSIGTLIEMVEQGRFDLDRTVFTSDNDEFLGDLQVIHDFNDIEAWPDRLKAFAKEYNLGYKFD